MVPGSLVAEASEADTCPAGGGDERDLERREPVGELSECKEQETQWRHEPGPQAGPERAPRAPQKECAGHCRPGAIHGHLDPTVSCPGVNMPQIRPPRD